MSDFKKDIWPKEYLYEGIHNYSLSVSCTNLCTNIKCSVYLFAYFSNYIYRQDLLNIPNRSLSSTLTKLVSLGRNHIKSCDICLCKGFVCEICRDPKVIFPFDLERIFKVRVAAQTLLCH